MYGYQEGGVEHQLEHHDSMLWVPMGRGKTVITLTTILERMDMAQVYGTLLVAPLRVIQLVWRQEAKKWSHTRKLRFSLIHGGTKGSRHRAMRVNTDIYLINYESLPWLCSELIQVYLARGRYLPFNCVVFDEVTKMKNMETNRHDAYRDLMPYIPYRMGLTGKPAPNGFKDLFGQYLAIDGGERLGVSKRDFVAKNFEESGFHGSILTIKSGAEKEIKTAIADITYRVPDDEMKKLPPLVTNDIYIELPPDIQKKYDQLEKEMFLELDNGATIDIDNAAALWGKCLQAASGALYTEPGQPDFAILHNAKLDALDSVISEAAGDPVLVLYAYNHDLKRLLERYPDAAYFYNGIKEDEVQDLLQRWNRGELPYFFGHPACLHPRTQLLTESRGWVNLVDIGLSDRVFDGVEFVSHRGCTYSGRKNTIEVLGITMTSNHKLLVGDKWTEARNVRSSKDTQRKALYQYQGHDPYLGEMCKVQNSIKDTPTKCEKAQQTWAGVLSTLRIRQVPWPVRDPYVEDMDGGKTSIERPLRSKLRRAWHNYVQRMGRLQKLLRRYAGGVLRLVNDRAERRKQIVLQRELYLGDYVGSTGKQAYESSSNLSGGGYTLSGTVQENRARKSGANNPPQSRDERRRSSGECAELNIRKGGVGSEKSDVYDLVNCGPRSRFVIRNDEGEVFISHNSMGHGLNFQFGGNTLAWYGLNINLEYYEQAIARILRDGQENHVIMHRLMCTNTLDMVVRDRLAMKAATQDSLIDTINDYRSMKK